MASPQRASAYSLRRAHDGQPIRWPGERVELRVDPAITGDAASAEAAVAMAAVAWRSPWSAPALGTGGAWAFADATHAWGGWLPEHARVPLDRSGLPSAAVSR